MRRARLVQHHRITRELLSVREHMSHAAAHAARSGASRPSRSCSIAGRGPQVVVVTFIALLELAREHLVEVTQAESFAPIYVRLAYRTS